MQRRIYRLPGKTILFSLFAVLITGCMGVRIGIPTDEPIKTPISTPVVIFPAKDCPVTEPVQATPPDDPAVQNPPAEGNYYINQDRSIWAAAWWTEQEDNRLKVSNDGVKVGWFRPAGVDLKISGRRIDEQAPPLEVDIPCCYPTQFQATGLFFPTGGCWQVNASTGDRSLTFVVDVDFILIPPTSSPALSLSQNIRLPDGEDATKYGLE